MTDFEATATGLKALAHPTRLQILTLLRVGETCVCHMEAALGKRQAYISQQLMVLRDAGIIDSRKEGRQVFYWLVDERTRAVLAVLLGPAPEDNPALPACPCPHCAAENDTSILIAEENIHAYH